MDWLAVAAVASIVGAVVAAVSAVVAVRQARSSYRSAAAAQEAVDLDRERLDTEQTPQLVGQYDGSAGGHGWLLLTNHGPIPIDRLHLKVVGGPHGEPPKVHFDVNGDPTREIARGGLLIGEQTHYALRPNSDQPEGRQEFEVIAHRADRSWPVRVAIEVPGDLRGALGL